MIYPVLVRRQRNGLFHAFVPSLAGLSREGKTKEETIKAARQAIVELVSDTEIVYLDVNGHSQQTGNHWVDNAGIFADDPTLLPMLEEVYTDRLADLPDDTN